MAARGGHWNKNHSFTNSKGRTGKPQVKMGHEEEIKELASYGIYTRQPWNYSLDYVRRTADKRGHSGDSSWWPGR